MNRFVGLDRELRLDWLDAVAGLSREGLARDAVVQRLNCLLADSIRGDEARQKTIVVLSRVWIRVPEEHKALRDQAFEIITRVESRHRLWLHWGMCLLAYPFFRDVASIVGQLGRLQGAVSQAQVQRRMRETWGERTTVQRAVRRLLRTWVDWKVVLETDQRGACRLAPLHDVQDRDLALWFLECGLRVHDAAQIPFHELVTLSYAFPFDLAPWLYTARTSSRFEIRREGLDLEMVAASLQQT